MLQRCMSLKQHILNLADKIEAKRLAAQDAGAIGLGAVWAIVGVLVAVLVFGAVAPSISTGLNNTDSAFAHITGVSGLLDVVPILLVIGVLFAVAMYYKGK